MVNALITYFWDPFDEIHLNTEQNTKGIRIIRLEKYMSYFDSVQFKQFLKISLLRCLLFLVMEIAILTGLGFLDKWSLESCGTFVAFHAKWLSVQDTTFVISHLSFKMFNRSSSQHDLRVLQIWKSLFNYSEFYLKSRTKYVAYSKYTFSMMVLMEPTLVGAIYCKTEGDILSWLQI